MKKIKLTQGKYALVDDADFEWLNQYKWYAKKKSNGSYYAVRSLSSGKNRIMHRDILGLKYGDGVQGDHRNHNSLDNQRHNLRRATCGQNSMNRTKQPGCTSLYKGVHWHKTGKKWVSQIAIGDKTKWLGLFFCQQAAARAYDNAARLLHGEFASVNFPTAGEQGCLG